MKLFIGIGIYVLYIYIYIYIFYLPHALILSFFQVIQMCKLYSYRTYFYRVELMINIMGVNWNCYLLCLKLQKVHEIARRGNQVGDRKIQLMQL